MEGDVGTCSPGRIIQVMMTVHPPVGRRTDERAISTALPRIRRAPLSSGPPMLSQADFNVTMLQGHIPAGRLQA